MQAVALGVYTRSHTKFLEAQMCTGGTGASRGGVLEETDWGRVGGLSSAGDFGQAPPLGACPPAIRWGRRSRPGTGESLSKDSKWALRFYLYPWVHFLLVSEGRFGLEGLRRGMPRGEKPGQ